MSFVSKMCSLSEVCMASKEKGNLTTGIVPVFSISITMSKYFSKSFAILM